MRKHLCTLLLCWLPIFMTATQAMSMEMAFNGITPTSQAVQLSQVHHDCHSDTQHSTDTNSNKHFCVACGVCVLSHAVSFETVKALTVQPNQSLAPPSFTANFTSQGYPPAIKPPISN